MAGRRDAVPGFAYFFFLEFDRAYIYCHLCSLSRHFIYLYYGDEMGIPKEALSLKRFMLRTEVIRLYRSYMRMGKLIEDLNNKSERGRVLRKEWQDWIRSEFRVRSRETDEDAIRLLISSGNRQLQELERSIRIANG